MEPWASVLHFFENRDEGFPDIWIENLSEDETLIVFRLLLSYCGQGHNQQVYSFERGGKFPIEEIIHPKREFGEGRFEDFSHELTGYKSMALSLLI